MKDWLITITEAAILFIDAIALLAILIGTVQAVVAVARRMLARQDHVRAREIWLHYSRWLVAGLTFQLASDIIETSISTSWQEVARLGAIAVIRTLLNYFLERDLSETRESLAAEGPVREPRP